MTREFGQRQKQCDNCGHLIATPEQEFNAWVRAQPDLSSSPSGAALSIMDIDFCVHKFVVTDKSSGRQLPRQHIMLMEHKSHAGGASFAQADTITAIDQMLKASHLTIAKVHRGYVKMFYHGFHVLRCSANGPNDSDWMEWNGKRISAETLKRLLRFELNPWTLREREDRLHHRKHPALEESWLTR